MAFIVSMIVENVKNVFMQGRIKRVKKKRKHAVDTLVLPVSKKCKL